MTKEKFLTKRWNNWLTIGMGIPTLAYGVFVLSTSVISDFAGFIGIAVMGAVYWTVVEWHSNKQLAWQRKNLGGQGSAKLRSTNRLIFIAWNVIYWIPLILPFTTLIDYRTGFVSFFALIIVRAIANVYRNNFLTLEQAERFPLRVPWIVVS